MVTLKRVVAGGLSGMLAKSVVAPVDRVKILFQVTNEKFSFKKVRSDRWFPSTTLVISEFEFPRA